MNRLMGAALMGAAFAAAQIAVFFTPLPPLSSLTFSFLNLGSVWACLGMVAGGFTSSWKTSMVNGAMALLAAVWVYYTLSWVLAPNMKFPLYATLVWSFAAVFSGPITGALGRAARRTDKWSTLPWIVGPLLIVLETAHDDLQGQNPDDTRLLVIACLVGTCAVAFGLMNRARSRKRDNFRAPIAVPDVSD